MPKRTNTRANSFDFLRSLCNQEQREDEHSEESDDNDANYLPDESDYEDNLDEVDSDGNTDLGLDENLSGDDGTGWAAENDDSQDNNDNDPDDGVQLRGKNGFVWDSEPSDETAGRRIVRDIVRQSPGIRNCNDMNSADQAFPKFVTDDIVMVVVRYTNQLGRATFDAWNTDHPDNLRTWKPVEDVVCRGFLGGCVTLIRHTH